MPDSSKVLLHMNPNSNQRLVIYSTLSLSPTLQSAMGTGGGQMPFIIVLNRIGEGNNAKRTFNAAHS